MENLGQALSDRFQSLTTSELDIILKDIVELMYFLGAADHDNFHAKAQDYYSDVLEIIEGKV